MTLMLAEYNVAVRQEAVGEKTKGGVILPQTMQEKNKHMANRGVIVGVSPMAFSFDDWPADEPKPQVGDTVVFAQHAGMFLEHDGEELRIIKDKDIVAVVAA